MKDIVDARTCVWVGGFITDENREFIYSNSKRNIQFAADKLQRSYIEGFKHNGFNSIYVMNFPFVGNYPRSFKSPTINSELIDGEGRLIIVRKYKTLSFLSKLEKTKVFLHYLNHIQNSKTGDILICFYALTSEHLEWIKLAKLMINDIKIILVVPDLPIFMNPSYSKDMSTL